MGYDGSLKFDTEINEKGFSQGLDKLEDQAEESSEKVGKQLEKSSKSISKLGNIAKSSFKVVGAAIGAVTAALGSGIAAGVKYNASIETYQTSFEVMTGSAEKAAEVVERLKKVGAETPFELPQLADTTQLLMNYGFTADEAMDKMMMLGDISQGSADKMTSIATAYGQMSSAGKVSLEDVKQMIEAGFNPLQEISESTGESMSSLYDRISEGTLTVDEITDSMKRATSEGGKYFQSMEKQSQTVSGMISTLKDNAQQLLGEVVQPITDSFAQDLLPAAIGAIEQLTTAFQTEGVDGLIQAGMGIVANLLLGISQALPSLLTTAITIITTFINSMTANLTQFMTAGMSIIQSLLQGMLTLLPSIGQFVVTLIATLMTTIATYGPQLIISGIQMIQNLLTGLLQQAPTIIQQVGSMMNQYLDNILSQLPSILDAGTQMIQNLLQGLVSNAPQILQQCFDMMSDFLNTILDHLPAILDAGVNLILSLLSGLIQTAPQIISQAASMLREFISEIASHLPEILQKGVEIIGELLAGIIQEVPNLLAAIPGIIADMASAFLDQDWAGIGWDIISGIASGIANAAGNLVKAAADAASNALNWVKDKLGIASPSKVFRDEVGKMMALGMGIGFEKNVPLKDMEKSLDAAVEDMQFSAARSLQTAPQSTAQAVKSVTNNYTGADVDYKKIKKAQLEAQNEANKQPIVLNGRNLRRELIKEGFVVT